MPSKTYLTAADRETHIKYLITEIEDSMDVEDFQRDFFESVSDQFSNGRKISDKQIDSLERIYERVTS